MIISGISGAHLRYRSSVRGAASAQKNSLQLQCIGQGGLGAWAGMMAISGDRDNVVTLNLTHLARTIIDEMDKQCSIR